MQLSSGATKSSCDPRVASNSGNEAVTTAGKNPCGQPCSSVMDFPPVILPETHEGEHLSLCFVHEGSELRHLWTQLILGRSSNVHRKKEDSELCRPYRFLAGN
jgi:hypothetical protein